MERDVERRRAPGVALPMTADRGRGRAVSGRRVSVVRNRSIEASTGSMAGEAAAVAGREPCSSLRSPLERPHAPLPSALAVSPQSASLVFVSQPPTRREAVSVRVSEASSVSQPPTPGNGRPKQSADGRLTCCLFAQTYYIWPAMQASPTENQGKRNQPNQLRRDTRPWPCSAKSNRTTTLTEETKPPSNRWAPSCVERLADRAGAWYLRIWSFGTFVSWDEIRFDNVFLHSHDELRDVGLHNISPL